MMKKLSFYIISITLLFFAASCADEDYNKVSQEEQKAVTLTLRLPGDIQGKLTKSMTEAEDQGVNAVDVLAFTDDGNGNFLYSYSAKGTNINIENDGTGKFQVNLYVHIRDQKFIILANSTDEVTALNPIKGETIDQILPRLVAISANEWEAHNNGTGILRYIPMYTKTPHVRIDHSTTTIGRYTLVRMLARFDVRVKNTVSNFQLANACIFHRKDKGYIAYNEDPAFWNGSKALKPHVPGDVTSTKNNSMLYNVPTGGPYEVIRSIYSFEAKKVADRSKRLEATAIVVGGYFDHPNNNSKISYYRIDIPPTIAGDFNGDILRNHLYDIEIQSVEDEGSIDPETAYNGEIKLTAKITPWNLAEQKIIFDGQYNFTIEYMQDGDLAFTNNKGETRKIIVKSTHPTPLIVDPIEYNDINNTGWMTIQKTDINEWSLTPVKNNFKTKRYAKVKFTAGNLEYYVPISQTGCGENGIPEPVEINGQSYITHLYNNDKCWFIVNSHEGYASAVRFGSGGGIVNGSSPPSHINHSYYSWDEASAERNACPVGWHLPTFSEFQDLKNEINLNPFAPQSQYWISESRVALTGYFNPLTNSWAEYAQNGYWWCNTNAGGEAQYAITNSSSMNFPLSGVKNMLLTVRCVKD